MLCSSPWRRPQKAQIPQIETGPDRHSTPAPPLAPVPPSKDSGVTGNVLIYSAPSPCQRPGPGHLLVSRPEWVVRGEPPCPHVAGVEPGPTLPAAASVSPVRRLSPLFKGPCRVPQLRLGSRPTSPCPPHGVNEASRAEGGTLSSAAAPRASTSPYPVSARLSLFLSGAPLLRAACQA